MHAIWMKNRTWMHALSNYKTPYEVLNGECPDLMRVPQWGCKVWVHDPSGGKLAPRAKEGH